MDTGYMEDGTITKGEYSKAITKEHTLSNTNGCIDIIKHLNSDFYTLQEVDTKSTRSYNINQKKMIIESLPNYTNTYSINFHSAYLAYPIYDMHGVANAGILTMSKYNMDYSKRYELPIDDSFVDKFFDLDRCINVSRYKINNSEKHLTIISVHLSAYDEFGVIRKEQMKLLKEIMQDEYNNGNYVIIGGDFNHDLVEGGSNFPTKQLKPDWIQSLTQEEFGNNFNIVCDNTKPSCRNADIPYEEGVTYTTVIDGFIISDNIEIVSIENISSINDEDTNFLYSDHNPVKMHFKLKEQK
jgi:endonuclease/exonuclease/phosphatase family metal-dependent hydrolase